MDRLVSIAWRAFWVGLGACAVLVVQAATEPAASGTAGREPTVDAVHEPPPPARKARQPKPGV